jgi:hypothetical protein
MTLHMLTSYALLVNFIQKTWPFQDAEKVTLSVRLSEDLGIRGDDAVEFLCKFSDEFKIDISNLVVENHFKLESNDFLSPLIRWMKGATEKKFISITVEDLLCAIELGRLDESVIKKQHTQ